MKNKNNIQLVLPRRPFDDRPWRVERHLPGAIPILHNTSFDGLGMYVRILSKEDRVGCVPQNIYGGIQSKVLTITQPTSM